MTDQVNEAVATLSERRQLVRHAAETYARANDDAKVRVLRKEEAALGLAIQSLQNAHPSRGVVDEDAALRLDEYLTSEHGVSLGKQAAIAALQAAQPAALSPLPLPERLAREADCTDEAARQFYAEGWNACLAAQPAVPSVPEADEVDVDAVMAIIDKWMISYDHIGTGSARSGQISEREWEEDRAKLLQLLATTHKDQPAQGVG